MTNYFKETVNFFNSTKIVLQPGTSKTVYTIKEPGDADYFLYRFKITSGLNYYSADKYRYVSLVCACITEEYEDVNKDKFVRYGILNCCTDITSNDVSMRKPLITNVQIPSSGATLKKVTMVLKNNSPIPVTIAGFSLFASYNTANAYTNSAIDEATADSDSDMDEYDDVGDFTEVCNAEYTSGSNTFVTRYITISKRGQTEWFGNTSRLSLDYIRFSTAGHSSQGTMFDMFGNKICGLGSIGGLLHRFTEYVFVVDKDIDTVEEITDGVWDGGCIIPLATIFQYYKGSSKQYHYEFISGTDITGYVDRGDGYPSSFDRRVSNEDSSNDIWWVMQDDGYQVSANYHKYEHGEDSIPYVMQTRYVNGLALNYTHDLGDGNYETVDTKYRIDVCLVPFMTGNLGFSDASDSIPTIYTTTFGNLMVFTSFERISGFEHERVNNYTSLNIGGDAEYEALVQYSNTRERINAYKPKITEFLNQILTREKITKNTFTSRLGMNIISKELPPLVDFTS
jgi:hypothetical protein